MSKSHYAVQDRTERSKRTSVAWPARALAVALSVLISSCEDNGTTPPDTLRFGQLGQIRAELEAPRGTPSFGTPAAGELHQILTWGSGGAWTFQESISYKGLVGDETFVRNPGDPAQYAADYASLITQVNEVTGLELFVDELSPDSVPTCGPTRTRLTFTIQDDVRSEEVTWVRCVSGSLSNLTPVDAGPDAAASRVALATMLARDRTLGDGYVYAYSGSVPFGTLDRGEDTPTRLGAPVVFLDQASWFDFWTDHSGSTMPFPVVNFDEEMVVVAAVGVRDEAGDSVEVRRILQVDEGTLTEIFERVPGDFCSPAARSHVPFHIVLAPRTPSPIRFSDIRVERVPCGG
jgi:hypothetical protein